MKLGRLLEVKVNLNRFKPFTMPPSGLRCQYLYGDYQPDKTFTVSDIYKVSVVAVLPWLS